MGERQRTVTPHQVAAVLASGELESGVTILHDCDLRLCCRTDPGHTRVATQTENMQQAAWRGRAVGPRPGLVDVRGKAGASRAVQAALRTATDRSPEGLAATLATVIAAGDPRANVIPLFECSDICGPRWVTGYRRAVGFEDWSFQRKVSLISEIDSARSLLEYGTRTLGEARAPLANIQDPILTTLSIGLEKLYKLTLGLVELDTNEQWPSEQTMRGFGHELGRMHRRVLDEIRVRSALRPYVLDHLTAVTADPVIGPMIDVLNDYGMSGRFYYLDLLSDDTVSRPDPRELWMAMEQAVDGEESLNRLFHKAAASDDATDWEQLLHTRNLRLAESVSRLHELVALSWRHGCLGQTGREFSTAVKS